VKRGHTVNRSWGEPADQLPERPAASDFEITTANMLVAS
jgi:GST-like protein